MRRTASIPVYVIFSVILVSCKTPEDPGANHMLSFQRVALKFRAPVAYVAAGDVEDDGIAELLVVHSESGGDIAFFGKELSTTRLLHFSYIADSARGMEMADFDGDGKREIVLANYGKLVGDASVGSRIGKVRIDGAKTETTYFDGEGRAFTSVAKFNLPDGTPSVVFVSETDRGVWVWPNANPTITFGFVLTSPAAGLAVGRFGVGAGEIALALASLDRRIDAFAKRPDQPGFMHRPLATAEFDVGALSTLSSVSDRDSLLVAEMNGPRASLLSPLDPSSYGFIKHWDLGELIRRIGAVDLDSDGRPDILFLNPQSRTVRAALSSISEQYDTVVSLAQVPHEAEFLVFGDFNGDRLVDIAIVGVNGQASLLVQAGH